MGNDDGILLTKQLTRSIFFVVLELEGPFQVIFNINNCCCCVLRTTISYYSIMKEVFFAYFVCALRFEVVNKLSAFSLFKIFYSTEHFLLIII